MTEKRKIFYIFLICLFAILFLISFRKISLADSKGCPLSCGNGKCEPDFEEVYSNCSKDCCNPGDWDTCFTVCHYKGCFNGKCITKEEHVTGIKRCKADGNWGDCEGACSADQCRNDFDCGACVPGQTQTCYRICEHKKCTGFLKCESVVDYVKGEATCQSDGTWGPCDAKCPKNECEENNECVGFPTPPRKTPPSCEDECPFEGARKCYSPYDCDGLVCPLWMPPPDFVPTKYQICGNYDSDPCLEWSSPIDCPSGQICVEGKCVPGCTDECSPAGKKERRCFGNKVQERTCEKKDSCLKWSEWKDVEVCSNYCLNGKCILPPKVKTGKVETY